MMLLLLEASVVDFEFILVGETLLKSVVLGEDYPKLEVAICLRGGFGVPWIKISRGFLKLFSDFTRSTMSMLDIEYSTASSKIILGLFIYA
jgi:hypothetical protein